MQFFQFCVGIAALLGCSSNLINGQKIIHTNKLIGHDHFASGNKLIGFDQIDAGNKLLGLSGFDTGNKIFEVQTFAQPSKLIVAPQPAHMHIGAARNFGLTNSGLSSFSVGEISPIVADNSALLWNANNNARAVQLVDASPSVATIGARSLDLAQVAAPQVAIVGRSSEPIIATQSVSADVKPVTAAVATISRTVDYTPVAYSGEPAKVQVVNVPPNEQGLHINFMSKSSPMTVSQQHIPGEAGQVHVTESVDEPQRLVHNVKKSVIQEVNEVVQPFRVLKQEIKPVIEQAHTLVAEGNKIPLSGRSSGVIATESIASANMLHQPTQVITAQEPRSLKISSIMEPAVEIASLAQPKALNIATVAQPRAMKMAIAHSPHTMKMAIAQPQALEIAAINQPTMADIRFEKLALPQQSGSLIFSDSHPGMIAEKRMIIHNQPSMFMKQKNIAMPFVTSVGNMQTFSKPATFTAGTLKMNRF